MNTCRVALVPVLSVFGGLAWTLSARGAGSQGSPVPKSMVGALPKGVHPGFFGASPETEAAKAGAPRDPPMVGWAVGRSVEYMQAILREEWLPSDVSQPNQFLKLVDDDFDEIDTVRAEYTKNGYHVQMVQSATLFALLLTPESSGTELRGGDVLAMVKAVGSRVLRHWDRVERISFASPKTVAEGMCGQPNSRLREEMAAAIRAEQRRIDQAFAEPPPVKTPPPLGSQPTPEQVKISVEANRKHYAECRAQEQECQKLRVARAAMPRESDLWWGWVGWWTDGQRIGFYTVTGARLRGAWGPSYEGIPERAKHWFEAVPSDPVQQQLRGYRK